MEDQVKSPEGKFSKDQLDNLLDVIQAINGAMVNIKRYPAGSAVISMALERGLGAFNELFKKVSTFTLSEHDRSMMIEGELLDSKTQQKAYVVGLRKQMHERNIRSITFHTGMTLNELVDFLTVLSDDPEKIKAIPDIGQYLHDRGIEHVDIDKKVFVALGKDQGIADLTELEALASSGRIEGMQPGDFKDGMFLSFLLSKIPLRDFNLKDGDVEKIKKAVDFDRLKQSKDLDFEQVGSLFADSLEQALSISQDLRESGEQGAPVGAEDPLERQKRRVSLLNQMRDQDEKVEKLVETFQNISRTIVSFDNPKIRAKLLADFIKVVTNFKALTLARLLSTELESPEGIDVKSAILASLNLKKKSKLIDLFLQGISRIVEGLAPADFKLDQEELGQTEQVLMRVLKLIKSREEAGLYGEKAKHALGMARLIRKEAQSEESLLILKMRRLIVKPPEFFIQDTFVDAFSEVHSRLTAARRPDIIKKLLERCAENFNSTEREVRISTVQAFIQITQGLYETGQVQSVGDCYNLLFHRMSNETDPAVFAMILASIVSGFNLMIEHEKFTLAANLLRSMQRMGASIKDGRQDILREGLARITRNHETIGQLLVPVMSEDENISNAASKVLSVMPADAVLPQLLKQLRTSEEMRVRKKCTNLIAKFGDAIVDPILQELSQNQPWYYIRNLINLLSNSPQDRIVIQMREFIGHKDERVRKACVNTLIRVNSVTSQQVLVEHLDINDINIAKLIVGYFGQCKSHAAGPVLLEKLSDKNLIEQSTDLACEMIQAVGRIGSPGAVEVLTGLIKKGGLTGLFQKRNEEILLAVLRAFSMLRDPKAAALASKYVRDKNPEVAKAAKLASQSG